MFKPLSKNTAYNPDILECLSDLSNDEIFTPPKVANAVLDLLPPEVWQNPELTFLDPACKTGIFLREIAKRLNQGLAEQIPNLQERLNHIYAKQLFGIAVTELTALVSRRSLYCSKQANGPYSIVKFAYSDGNIHYFPTGHTWENGSCRYCGASIKQYQRGKDLESHAYEFIHTNNPEEIFNMKFDIVIGNPPYQLSDGGAGASAKPIYNYFIDSAKKLNPRFLCMVVPSRWMTGGKGLDSFRSDMINDRHIAKLHDFLDAKEVFPSVDVKGGICYFLRDSLYQGTCDISTHSEGQLIESKRYLKEGNDDIFIRHPILIAIKEKIQSLNEDSVSTIVSARKPYGLATDVLAKDATKKYGIEPFSDEPVPGGYRIIGRNGKDDRIYKYLPSTYKLPKRNNLSSYKVFVPKAYGDGTLGEIPKAELGLPGDLCTETFLQLAPFKAEDEAKNFLSYFHTKFFRCLVGIMKQTQNTTQSTYRFVPMQDFSKPWTDQELYEKYRLSPEEIDFIESNIQDIGES